MARGLDKTVHHFAERDGKVLLVRTTPYVRIVHGGEPPIFVQGGQFWYEEAPDPIPTEDLPGWMPAQLLALSPRVIEEVGIQSFVQELNKSRTALEVAMGNPAPAKPPEKRRHWADKRQDAAPAAGE